jgi:hypothetical protein
MAGGRGGTGCHARSRRLHFARWCRTADPAALGEPFDARTASVHELLEMAPEKSG